MNKTNQAQFYGWINIGNRRTEIYKGVDAHGDPVWTSIQVWCGDPFGQNNAADRRIAAESVANYDVDPDFNIN